MKTLKLTLVLAALAIFASGAAFADDTLDDPVGFCSAPASVQTCTTGTGVGGETIGISSTTQFGMYKNGNGGTPIVPWYLLVAIPEPVGGGIGAPTITNADGYFTQVGTVIDEGKFYSTSSGSIYDFVTGQSGDNNPATNQSMNATNLFSQNEINAAGGLPSYFEIFAYEFKPAIQNNTPYVFDASGLVAGTYLAAAGGSQPFSTPYTVAGLITGSSKTVPEPGSMLLLGTGLTGIAAFLRKRRTEQ